MQFWQPCRNMFEKKLKVFSWMSEKDEKIISFREFFSPYKVIFCTLTLQFWLPHRENFEKKAQKFLAQCPKMNLFLFKQFYEFLSQPKTFVCARRIQFWQTQRNCFDSRLKNISLMSENPKIFFSSEFNLASKCSSGHWESKYDRHFENLSTKSRNLFARYPKMRKNFFPENEHLYWVFVWTRRMQFSQPC